jgi:hypothetical protein
VYILISHIAYPDIYIPISLYDCLDIDIYREDEAREKAQKAEETARRKYVPPITLTCTIANPSISDSMHACIKTKPIVPLTTKPTLTHCHVIVFELHSPNFTQYSNRAKHHAEQEERKKKYLEEHPVMSMSFLSCLFICALRVSIYGVLTSSLSGRLPFPLIVHDSRSTKIISIDQLVVVVLQIQKS